MSQQYLLLLLAAARKNYYSMPVTAGCVTRQLAWFHY
jgi:hypothetical protein